MNRLERNSFSLASAAGLSMALVLVLATRVDAQAVEVEQHTEAAPLVPPAANETQLNLSAGGTASSGNTRAWQVNAGGDFRLVRDVHAVGAMVNYIYGQADVPDDGVKRLDDTVRNLNAKLRYDYYLTTMDALFVAAGYRWDTFAGLDLRFQAQGGYLRNFVLEDAMRFWGEIGYDMTYDNYTNAILLDVPGTDEVQVVHSARGFIGYDNHISETFSWITGLEALMNVERPSDTRINWDNAVRSHINGNLDLEVKFSLKYDHVPVPGTRSLDTYTQISIIYALLADVPPPATDPAAAP